MTLIARAAFLQDSSAVNAVHVASGSPDTSDANSSGRALPIEEKGPGISN